MPYLRQRLSPSHPPAAESLASSPLEEPALSRRERQLQLVSRSHHNQLVIDLTHQRSHIAVACVVARGGIPVRIGCTWLYRNCSGCWRVGSITGFENPRKCRSAAFASSLVSRTGGAPAFSIRKISSQYTHRLVTIRTSRGLRQELARSDPPPWSSVCPTECPCPQPRSATCPLSSFTCK